MEVVSREVRKNLLKKIPSHTDPRIKKARKHIESEIELFIKEVVIPLENDFDFANLEKYWNVYREAKDVRRVPPFEVVPKEECVEKIVELLSLGEGENDGIEKYFQFGYSFLSDCYSAISIYNRNKMSKERLATCFSSENPVDWVKNFKETQLDPKHIEILGNIGVLLQIKI